MFSDDKRYGGGPIGASVEYAHNMARKERKKYFAVARAGDDGHAFVFNNLSPDAEYVTFLLALCMAGNLFFLYSQGSHWRPRLCRTMQG